MKRRGTSPEGVFTAAQAGGLGLVSSIRLVRAVSGLCLDEAKDVQVSCSFPGFRRVYDPMVAERALDELPEDTGLGGAKL